MPTVEGMNESWEVFVRPSGLEIHLSKYLFVLEIAAIANQEIMTHHYLSFGTNLFWTKCS